MEDNTKNYLDDFYDLRLKRQFEIIDDIYEANEYPSLADPRWSDGIPYTLEEHLDMTRHLWKMD